MHNFDEFKATNWSGEYNRRHVRHDTTADACSTQRYLVHGLEVHAHLMR